MPIRPADAIVLLLVVACTGDGSGGDSTTTIAPPVTETTTTTTTAPAATCSAGGIGTDVADQDGLPEPVADTRRAIAEAALSCDYRALAELAGPSFTYSFGDGGDPVAHWRALEEQGEEPLTFLVEILRRPHGTVETENRTIYVWPSAFAYSDWNDVPEDDRRALEPLYGDEDFAFFERFGGYIGYRVGVTSDGTWLFFVAGD